VCGIVHTHHADAELVGKFHAALHGFVGNGLSEFLMSVPDFRCGEARWQDFDFRCGNPFPDLAAEEVVKVKRLECVVRANAMPRGAVAETRGVDSLLPV
jgi:hypothetical protein